MPHERTLYLEPTPSTYISHSDSLSLDALRAALGEQRIRLPHAASQCSSSPA